jgi:urease alpha subunit
MASSTSSSPSVIVMDPMLGIVKADIGIKDGRIVGIGQAGTRMCRKGWIRSSRLARVPR